MIKRIVILFIFILIAAAIPAMAQTTDNKILGINTGVVLGYSLTTNAPIIGQQFGLDLTVASNVQVGYYGTKGEGALDGFNLMKFSYFIAPQLGIDLLVGKNASGTAAGAGAFFNIFKSESGDLLGSAVKAQAHYLFDVVNGLAGGVIAFSLSGSIGL